MKTFIKTAIWTGALMALIPSGVQGGEKNAEGTTRHEALQSISYEFGSKFISGHFLNHAGTCLVTLMVIEKSPLDQPLPVTAARVRLVLSPGQIAGLDSEEGRSLNFTCGGGASALLVDTGERGRLAALQRSSGTGCGDARPRPAHQARPIA